MKNKNLQNLIERIETAENLKEVQEATVDALEICQIELKYFRKELKGLKKDIQYLLDEIHDLYMDIGEK